ncbi:sulfite exporter TauE/SafE [bacterium BMS3Abin09]|nr:sulfite exporter TauE/SafE [bacterium BMS3Abin09]GBE41216.1 sulfite exporter TauE/SafE [bacterium BMS3Bbin09]HDH33888.1 sulfite exporter TauE/SafE family protein [Nitrospirota bacterium]
MITFALISLIFLIAGFIQGLSGFGSALLAMPLLTIFIDVKVAVPLCILNSLLITSYLSFKLKDYMEMKKILPLIIGSLPGIYLGIVFLKSMESNLIKMLLGIMIILYCIYSFSSHPGPRKLHRAWAYIAGFGSGFIGTAFSAGGPPSIIYTTLTGWSKDHIKATLTGFYLVGNIIIVIAHAASGLTNTLVLKYFLASALFVISGVYLGSRVYDRTDTEGYMKIILVILMLLGIMMIGSAIDN